MIELNSVMEIIKEFEQPCSCGREHCTAVQDVQIGSGLVKSRRNIKEKRFSEKHSSCRGQGNN